jgi:hypothetical protein
MYGADEIVVRMTTNEQSTDVNGVPGCFKAKEGNLSIILKNEPSRPEVSQAEVFLHEIIEAIDWRNELELPHQAKTILSTNLLDLIRTNNLDFRAS